MNLEVFTQLNSAAQMVILVVQFGGLVGLYSLIATGVIRTIAYIVRK